MTVNQAIDYLEKIRHRLSDDNSRKKLRKIINLFKQLPKTKDGIYVISGDCLKPHDGIDYLFEPCVKTEAYFVLSSGQHIVDGIENYEYQTLKQFLKERQVENELQ